MMGLPIERLLLFVQHLYLPATVSLLLYIGLTTGVGTGKDHVRKHRSFASLLCLGLFALLFVVEALLYF